MLRCDIHRPYAIAQWLVGWEVDIIRRRFVETSVFLQNGEKTPFKITDQTSSYEGSDDSYDLRLCYAPRWGVVAVVNNGEMLKKILRYVGTLATRDAEACPKRVVGLCDMQAI